MDPAVMDPSHPGYPAWIAGKYPDATLDEINGIMPPPASPHNGIVLPPAGPDNGIVPARAPQLSVAPSHPPQPIPVAVVPIPLLAPPPSIHQPVLPNGGLVLEALTQQVLAVPARRRQARELAALPPQRLFEMRVGRTWLGHTHPSYSPSACAYVVGEERFGNRRCLNCVTGGRACPRCVVVQGLRTNSGRWLGGACAGCFYGAHPEICSFFGLGDDEDDDNDGRGGGKELGKRKRGGKNVDGGGGGKRGKGMGGLMGNGAGRVAV